MVHSAIVRWNQTPIILDNGTECLHVNQLTLHRANYFIDLFVLNWADCVDFIVIKSFRNYSSVRHQNLARQFKLRVSLILYAF